jgi:NADPH:quinone reductase-like Zn-dependent oxidoreductase
MAERTVVERAFCVEVPEGMEGVMAAAIANPGMSSWVALTERTRLLPGETVLINGSTGVSGKLAIGIAKHLGTGRVVATGRNAASVEG